MRFLGTYIYKTENGTVQFPWNIKDDKMMWIITESREHSSAFVNCTIITEEELDVFVTDGKSNSDEFSIIAKGEILLSDDDKWKLPDEIINYIKSDTVNFLGVGDFIEILTPDAMDKYNDVIKNMEDELSW